MRWAARVLIGAVLASMSGVSAFAQTADETKAANLNALGMAMARQILAERSGGAAAPETVSGALTDLNVDRYAEVFAFRDPSSCTGAECGLFLFSLDGKEARDLFEQARGARTAAPGSIGVLNQKRNGYFDVALGDAAVSWNGTGFAPVSSFATTSLNLDRFAPLCAGYTGSDYQLQQAAVDLNSARKTICTCMGARFGELGFSQDALDRYGDYLAVMADDDYENDDPALAKVGPLSDEANDVREGCMVQNGWANWNWPYAQGDAETPQVALAFDGFLAGCAAADWLTGNRKVGSHARTIGTCGCVARKLAAQGFRQPELDGVGRLYAGEIAEAELAKIRADAIDTSDGELDACLGELPDLAPAP